MGWKEAERRAGIIAAVTTIATSFFASELFSFYPCCRRSNTHIYSLTTREVTTQAIVKEAKKGEDAREETLFAKG